MTSKLNSDILNSMDWSYCKIEIDIVYSLCFEMGFLFSWHVNNEHVEIFVESSKTDQFSKGAWVPIAHTNSDICPIAVLQCYFHLADIQGNAEKLLFRSLSSTKQGYCLRPSGGLSYTWVREQVLEKLKELGLDPKQFSLYSLRSGGASAAASAGVPDRWFKRHGRWLSENAKDGYVKDKLEDRLSVTRSLGL